MSTPERKFMHDISTPLGVALGMIETVLETNSVGKPFEEVDQKRLQAALNAINKVCEMIHARRELIKSSTSDTSNSDKKPSE